MAAKSGESGELNASRDAFERKNIRRREERLWRGIVAVVENALAGAEVSLHVGSLHVAEFPEEHCSSLTSADDRQRIAQLLTSTKQRLIKSCEGGAGAELWELFGRPCVVASLGEATPAEFILVTRPPNAAAEFAESEIAFVGQLASSIADVLRSLRETDSVSSLAQWAATGRIAALCAHDAAKQIFLLRAAAERLDRRLGDADLGAREIAELARAVALGVNEVVAVAMRASAAGGSRKVSLLGAINRGIANVRRIRPSCRIEVRLTSEVDRVRVPTALATVIENLVDNAVLASGGSTVPVVVSAVVADANVVVEVVDSGGGVRSDVLAAVLGGAVGTTTRAAQGGKGLGLALAIEVVELLGGSLDLLPELSQGTRAILSVPWCDKSD